MNHIERSSDKGKLKISEVHVREQMGNFSTLDSIRIMKKIEKCLTFNPS